MNVEQRQRQMLASLPLLLQGGANIGELCRHIARTLSGEPEDCALEYGITRLLRSRWHSMAQGWSEPVPELRQGSELGRIGALFGFPPARGEQVEAFRRRLVEFIAIHRAGLTTASAILRLVALVYQAEDRPAITWVDDPPRTTRIARAAFMAAGPGGERREVNVDLLDNPTAPNSVHFAQVPAASRLTVTNMGLDPAIPEIRLHPLGKPARAPMFVHSATGLRLIYVGVVKPDETLTLRNARPPLINGIPQSDATPVLLTNPFVFDGESSRFAGPGLEGARFSVASLQGKRSLANEAEPIMLLAPGESTWIYDAIGQDELKAFLAPFYDLNQPTEVAALDKLVTSVADPVPAAPTADIELEWDESVPASFALRVPADHVPHVFELDGESDPGKRLGAFVRELEWALNYGRAAGIRARVELALPHVSESLDLGDAHTTTVEVSLAEQQPIGEDLPPPTPGVHIDESLPEIADPLFFGGHFNETLFDTSLFN